MGERTPDPGPLDVGYFDRGLPLARHPRGPGDEAARRRLKAVADQVDMAVAIGELYRADWFAAPDAVWERLRQACPELVDSAWISPLRRHPATFSSGGGAAGVVCVAGVPGRLVGGRWIAPGMVVHGFQG